MTRARFWLILIGVAVAGYALGRMTASIAPGRMLGMSGAGSPLFPAPPKTAPVAEAPAAEGDIVVEVPAEGAALSAASLEVAGRAVRNGGPIAVVVKDSAGSVLATAEAPIDGQASEAFGRFAATLAFSSPPSGDATVEFARAFADASSAQAPVIRHVRFSADASGSDTEVRQGRKVQLYFHNGELGPADDCSLVFPVDRTAVPDAGGNVTAATVTALLAGPSAAEKAKGYTTAIPDGAALNAVSTDAEGMTTADFAASLERGVAGSCRVQAIRAQIETTLRQFPDTRDVTISVQGQVDTALQP